MIFLKNNFIQLKFMKPNNETPSVILLILALIVIFFVTLNGKSIKEDIKTNKYQHSTPNSCPPITKLQINYFCTAQLLDIENT